MRGLRRGVGRRRQAYVGATIVVLWAVLSGGGCDARQESGAQRTITVWAHHGREDENAAMRQIVEAFNKAHAADGLQAKIEFFPDRQYADKVSIAARSEERR